MLTTLSGRPNARRSEGAQQIDVAGELIGLQPDVLLATSTPVTSALARETQTIPIVFALVNDPISSRFVASLSHPGGNLTGFTVFEASITSKMLELLREIAPGIKRVAMMFNPDTALRELVNARVRDRRQVIQHCADRRAGSQRRRY